jgi:Fe-S cluster assembly ATP-binding protein
MTRPMLEIRNLHVTVGETEILKGIDLAVNPGEVHAIMGPNGSGKSTLARALAGHPSYVITEGKVLYEGKDLLEMDPDKRAKEGVFLAFQYPTDIPGVSNAYFLKAALNEIRTYRGEEELDAVDFLKLLREKLKVIEMEEDFINRPVNEGFSGGEKKRNEILQMAVLEPKLAVLDETDSGLDIDALKIVASGVTRLKRPDRAIVLVTHYQRILNYIIPDFVHVLWDGRFVKSGGKELALQLEEKGYDWLKGEAEPASRSGR